MECLIVKANFQLENSNPLDLYGIICTSFLTYSWSHQTLLWRWRMLCEWASIRYNPSTLHDIFLAPPNMGTQLNNVTVSKPWYTYIWKNQNPQYEGQLLTKQACSMNSLFTNMLPSLLVNVFRWTPKISTFVFGFIWWHQACVRAGSHATQVPIPKSQVT